MGDVIDEPEVGRDAAAVPVDAVGPTIGTLEALPEDALLALIGAAELTPVEQRSVALLKQAPEELGALLLDSGLVVDAPIDLVARGRKTVERLLAQWGDQLREKICPLREKKGMRRAELAIDVAAILGGLTSLGAATIAAIAVLLVKFSLDELCDGWGAPVRPPRQFEIDD